jgi:hypothetical protein
MFAVNKLLMNNIISVFIPAIITLGFAGYKKHEGPALATVKAVRLFKKVCQNINLT